MSKLFPDREAVHALVAPSAKLTLTEFVEYHGISVTGWLEALLTSVAEETEAAGSMDDVMADIVRKARAIDAARRRRDGRKRSVVA